MTVALESLSSRGCRRSDRRLGRDDRECPEVGGALVHDEAKNISRVLAPSPWKSGSVDVDQGISKAGNPRLRRTMIQLAWLWLRHQPGSALSRWFHERVGERRGRIRRITIVAVARKLLIALWRYITRGLVPEGAQG
jgi:hypothetical protein